MNLQYITDSQGKTTGVFIPIEEWTDLKSKMKDFDLEEVEIPEWHKTIVRERMEAYRKNPEQTVDFDTAIDEIEKGI